jgi:spore coat protein U-like protein
MNLSRSRRLAALTLLVLITPIASRTVHAQVLNCTVTATSVIFGTYTPLQPTALSGTGTITTVCTVASEKNNITVALSPGASGGFTTRTMTTTVGTTASPLNYNLYQDAANNLIWGDGTGGSQPNTVKIMRHAGDPVITTNVTVYGAVAPSQDPAPGIYSDGINVTVNF